MIRIKDIAKEAQVSEGTVDRVIHNRGGVSKKTEQKIRAIIKKHDFTINPVASALAMKNNYNIAVLIPSFNEEDPFWKLPYMGILKAETEVKRFGVNIHFFEFNQYSPESYLKTFNTILDIKPNAVVFVPLFLKETKEIIKRLELYELPYMFLNVDIQGFNNTAYIGQDAYTAGLVAGKFMHWITSSNAEFLTIQSRDNLSDNNAISKRIEGFESYFKEQKLPRHTISIKIEDLNDKKNCAQKINSILKSHPNIEGLFVPSSRISKIVDCLNTKTLKNLKLIGFDNTPQNVSCLKSDLVSILISQKPFEQGYESVRLMTDFLRRSKLVDSKIYLPIEILTKENVAYSERMQHEFETENLKTNDPTTKIQ